MDFALLVVWLNSYWWPLDMKRTKKCRILKCTILILARCYQCCKRQG